jgi:Ca-activated chloride channel family protein
LVGLLVTHRPISEDGYFAVARAERRPHGHCAAARRRGGARRIGIDVGDKLAQAKAALEQLLGSLREGDRFRIVAFASGVRRFAAEWTPATTEQRRRAVDWVRALNTDGGTNIAGALEEAYSLPPTEGALGVVVFLTDGLPTVGEQDPERIAGRAEQRRGGFRVFSFGIGYDVNTYLLDRLTERARGITEYITPGGNIEQAVGALAGKIASPVLTDVRVDGGNDVELYDLQPGTLPDLFAGDEMVVFGRFRGVGRGAWAVAVHGRRNGVEERFRSGTAGAGDETANDYIPRLWAARKLERCRAKSDCTARPRS